MVKYLLIIIIILNIFGIISYLLNKMNKEHYNIETTPIFNRIKEKVKDQKTLPKKLFQTHYDKSVIPQKVKDNIKQYASDYEYHLFDDKDAILFLKKEYGQLLVDTFNSIRGGAHRADLLRYCLLYRYGGVYADIKTEFLKPLNEIFTQDNTFYTVLSIMEGNGCYQGVIATPPCNDIFIDAINYIISIDKQVLNLKLNYQLLCRNMQQIIENRIEKKKIKSDRYITPNYNIILFQEHGDCGLYTDLEPDIHTACSKILDINGNPIINTRYSDYPW